MQKSSLESHKGVFGLKLAFFLLLLLLGKPACQCRQLWLIFGFYKLTLLADICHESIVGLSRKRGISNQILALKKAELATLLDSHASSKYCFSFYPPYKRFYSGKCALPNLPRT